MTKVMFEVGKTYVFHSGAARFRGIVTKRTKKTITVKIVAKGVCYLWGLLYEEDAEKVAPITLRIQDKYEEQEFAVTRSAGKYKDRTLRSCAMGDYAIEQL